jgi:hypothetical protein
VEWVEFAAEPSDTYRRSVRLPKWGSCAVVSVSSLKPVIPVVVKIKPDWCFIRRSAASAFQERSARHSPVR